MNRLAALTLLMLGSTLVGCTSGRSETFDIDIRNATDTPLTLSLAKNGTPWEPAWATPEDLAIETPKRREEWAGGPTGLTVLQPGKTGYIKGLTGRFNTGVRGFIRAYKGDLRISDMLAVGPDSSARVDVPLRPGQNKIVIENTTGRLAAKPDQ